MVKIRRFHGRASLIVPKSFEGRKGTETHEGNSLELFERFEFSRNNVQTRFQGQVNRFEFDTKIDGLKGLAWQSRKSFPKRNLCMDCHGDGYPRARTQVWFGRENRQLEPKRFTRNQASIKFPEGTIDKDFFELRHWVSPHQEIHFGMSKGWMQSYNIGQKAFSAWGGWSWHNRKSLQLFSQLRASKADLYEQKREFIGRLQWKGKGRFSMSFQGGILLDGFAQYDLGFSDVGAVIVSSEQGNSEDLPTIYTKMKNERFGYYSFQARYEYAF